MPDARPSRFWQPDFPFKPARSPLFYGWVIVFAGTVGMVFSIPGQTMGFSVFTDSMMADLGLSRDALSWAYCLGTVVSGFTLPIFGRAFDRLGARKMVVYSAIATGLILFYLASSKKLLAIAGDMLPNVSPTPIAFAVIALGFYMIRASAQGVLTMASRNAMGKWFDYHRGLAMAISGVAVSFAFAAAPRLLDPMISAYGAHGTWFRLGVATIVIMAGIGWLLFRDNPEECGLRMDGDSGDTPPARKQAHADSITHREFTRAEALRTAPFWAFNLSFGFWSLFATAFTFHVVSIGAEAGRDRAEIIGLFLPAAAVSVCSNLFCGWISPHARLKWLLVMMNVAALLAVGGMLKLSTPMGALAWVIGAGTCGGAFAALSGIVWPRFFGRAALGAISGVGMSTMVIASGLGPILFSLAKTHTGSYAIALWGSAAVPALLILLSLWADNPQRRHSVE
jgi:sugar phosphate permease